MSEEMARKKREEADLLNKLEEQARKEVAEDVCPVCKLPTSKVEFLNMGIVKTFGWIECTRCGAIYCPKSIMKQKRIMASSGVVPNVAPLSAPPSNLVIE